MKLERKINLSVNSIDEHKISNFFILNFISSYTELRVHEVEQSGAWKENVEK